MAMTEKELDAIALFLHLTRESFKHNELTALGLLELDDHIRVVEREKAELKGMKFETINPDNVRVLTNGAKSVKEGEQFDIDKVGFPSYGVPLIINFAERLITLRDREGEVRMMHLDTTELFHRPEEKKK